MVQLSVSGQHELKALAHRLKTGAKELRPELRKAIKKAAAPAVRDVQEAARTISVRGARGGGRAARALHHASRAKRKADHGLRATIARATRADIKLGGEPRVTIRTYSRYLPADQRRLPRLLDRPQGWRHPVFGNRESWAAQFGEPWFGHTLKKHGPKVRDEVLDAMHRVGQKITRG